MKKKTILTSAGYVTIRLSRQVWRFSLLRSFILAMLCAVILMGCSTDNDDNPAVRPEYTGVPLIILDTDIGSSTDDLFTLQMLHYYQRQGRCKLLGVIVDREGEECAACADVMNTYFNCGDAAWCSAMLEKIRSVNKTH